MNRFTEKLISLACCLCFFAQPMTSVRAGPAESVEPNSGYQPERMQDPYMPGPRQLDTGASVISAAPPGSVQVNVNGSGNNIPGDAANEPSIAIDPTNP